MPETDPVRSLLAGLAAPRPLPDDLRDRLEAALLPSADAQLAARLTAATGPRDLPPPLREALRAQLSRPARRRREALVAGAASLVLVVAAVAAVSGSSPRPAPLARPAPSSGPAPTTGVLPPAQQPPAAGAAPSLAPPPVSPAPAPGPVAPPAGATAGSPPSAASGSTTAGTAGGAAAAGAAAGTAPQPSVSSVTPDAGPVSGGTRVTVQGRGLSRVVRLEVGGRAATGLQVQSDSSVSGVTPPAARAGGAQVVAVLADGGRYGLSPGFRYLDRPVLTRLDPPQGPVTGGTTVTLTGRHFTPSSLVEFGGTRAERVAFVSSTTLRAVAPASLPGPADVVVTTAGGRSGSARYLYGPSG